MEQVHCMSQLRMATLSLWNTCNKKVPTPGRSHVAVHHPSSLLHKTVVWQLCASFWMLSARARGTSWHREQQPCAQSLIVFTAIMRVNTLSHIYIYVYIYNIYIYIYLSKQNECCSWISQCGRGASFWKFPKSRYLTAFGVFRRPPWKGLSGKAQTALAQAQQEHGFCVKHGVCVQHVFV